MKCFKTKLKIGINRVWEKFSAAENVNLLYKKCLGVIIWYVKSVKMSGVGSVVGNIPHFILLLTLIILWVARIIIMEGRVSVI
jgi:hypothetical protein